MIGGRMIFSLTLAGAVAAGLYLLWDHGRETGRAEVRAAWEVQKSLDAAANRKAALEAMENQKGLQRAIEQINHNHEARVATIRQQHAAAIDSVRKRAARPSDYVPAAPGNASPEAAAGCGADQLFREDAVAALGIAADADVVRESLMECRAAYDAARQVGQR